MSKMTQRRMARRASRKVNELRRENRFVRLLASWKDDNIDQLKKALRTVLDREKATKVAPAVPA